MDKGDIGVKEPLTQNYRVQKINTNLVLFQ